MAERIPVAAVVVERTHVGCVKFPTAVPEGLAALLKIPDDLREHAGTMGLDRASVDFIFAITRGKFAVTASLDLQALAIKTGWKYPDMDRMVRELIQKNYARLSDRLDLYRFWIVLLHVKGIRFRTSGE